MHSSDQFSEALPDEDRLSRTHLETSANKIIPDLIPDHSPPIQASKPDQLKSVRPPDQINVSPSDHLPAVHQLA